MLQTQHGDNYIKRQGELAQATTVPTHTTTSQPGTPTKTTKTKPLNAPKTTQSAASRDSIKASKTNSNVVKHKDELVLEDSLVIQEQFIKLCGSIKDKPATQKRLNLMVGTKLIYDDIKNKMSDMVILGARAAAGDLGVDFKGLDIKHDLFSPLDKLRDSVIDMVSKDETKVSKASLRISTASRTEQARAYNYGYALLCTENDVKQFNLVKSDTNEVMEILNIDKLELDKIPPFHPNSRVSLKIEKRVEKVQDMAPEMSVDARIQRDKAIADMTGIRFSKEYLISHYGYKAEDFA
jgi:hypothetical protein